MDPNISSQRRRQQKQIGKEMREIDYYDSYNAMEAEGRECLKKNISWYSLNVVMNEVQWGKAWQIALGLSRYWERLEKLQFCRVEGMKWGMIGRHRTTLNKLFFFKNVSCEWKQRRKKTTVQTIQSNFIFQMGETVEHAEGKELIGKMRRLKHERKTLMY